MTKTKRQFQDLTDRLESEIIVIDNTSTDWIDSVNENIDICNTLINQLRDRYEAASLEEADQIDFFKNIKPKFASELLFQGHVLQYYHGKPKTNNKKSIRRHIKDHRVRTNAFLSQYLELHNYMVFRSEHMDQAYFGHHPYDARVHGALVVPTDPKFSSPADPTLSLIQSNGKFLEFLELEFVVAGGSHSGRGGSNRKRKIWKGSQTEFAALIYGLVEAGLIDMEIHVLSTHAQRALNLEIDNIYRTFNDVKRKKNPTEVLDKLKTALNEKIREEN